MSTRAAAALLGLLVLAGCGRFRFQTSSDTDAGVLPNRAPEILGIDDQVVYVGEELAVTLSATDEDGDTLVWTAEGLPAGATFDAQTQVFRWRPTEAQLGLFEPVITVTDDGTPELSSTLQLSLTVRQALVRVRVSAMLGDEPSSLSSTSHPDLFVLAPGIASASLSVTNASLNKPVDAAGTFRAALAPVPPAPEAGYIELTVTPDTGESVAIERVLFTTSARFASNPSGIELRTSVDGFATVVLAVPLDVERATVAPVASPPSGEALVLRWVATSNFGDFGGGQAGFSTADLILER